EIERIFAAAGASSRTSGATWSGVPESNAMPALRSTRSHHLQAGGRTLGIIGVASPAGFTAVQQRMFGLFANQAAAALGVAELVAARKGLFWRLTDEGMLVPIAGAHGIDGAFLARVQSVPCAPDRDDLASRVVFHDLMFKASRADESGDLLYALDALNVHDAIAMPWRAGDQRLGLVAAYDSRRADGFSREDAWVLQKAGLAAGLVWQLKYAEVDLK